MRRLERNNPLELYPEQEPSAIVILRNLKAVREWLVVALCAVVVVVLALWWAR